MPDANNNGNRPDRPRILAILPIVAVALLAALSERCSKPPPKLLVSMACGALLLLLSDGAEGRTITVDDDGGADYEMIQDALDNATNGDTIQVNPGIYHEYLNVRRQVDLIGCGDNTTLLDNCSFTVRADGVVVTGFTITGDYWISLYSDDNRVLNNSFSNKVGLALFSSNNNTLQGNSFTGCGIFINVDHEDNWMSQMIDESNTVNGKPLYFWKDRNNETVPPEAGQIILAGCENITIEGQDCSNGSVGISVGFSGNITIKNNRCANNDLMGICVWRSDHNTIASNTCPGNVGEIWGPGAGLYMWNSDFNLVEENILEENRVEGMILLSSDHNTVSRNICTGSIKGLRLKGYHNSIGNNTFSGNSFSGIELDSADHNLIADNNCSGNGRYGMWAHFSDRNTLERNTCSGNEYGIYLEMADHNALLENFLSMNKYGIYLEWNADRNKLSRNEFSDNERNVKEEEGPREPIPVIFLAILVVGAFCVIPIIGIVWSKRKRRSDGLNLAVILFVCQIFIMGGVMLLAGAFFMARESEGILMALMAFYICGHPGMVMLLSPIVNRSFPLDLGNPKSSALVLSLLIWFGIILFIQGLSIYDHERYHSEDGWGGIFLCVLGIIAIIFGIVMIRVFSTDTLQNFRKQGQEIEKQSADMQNEE